MIKKFLLEPDAEGDYQLLSQDRKDKYTKVWTELNNCPEEYVVAVDISKYGSKEYSSVTAFEIQSDGSYKIIRQELF